MTLYFSKNNIFSLIDLFIKYKKGEKTFDFSYYLIHDAIKMIFEDSKRYFCFDEKDLDEDELNQFDIFLGYFSEGQGTYCETKFGVSYKNSIDEMDINEIMSMYFISDDDNILNLGRNKLIICCEEIGKEFETFIKVFIRIGNRSEKQIPFEPLEYNNEGKKKYWEHRLNYIEYLTDIFIDDPYIIHNYGDSDDWKNMVLENIICILSTIINNPDSKINIVIRTSTKKNRTTEFDDEILKKIKKRLKRQFRNKKINLTLISNWGYPNSKSIDQHDREIISNYDFFMSGIGFKLFNNQDKYGYKLKNNYDPTIPLANHRQTANKFRLKEQNIRVKDFKVIDQGLKDDKIQIFGDKKSNFINFPSN